ncbi:MAG: DUF2851 family protein [Cyclobacteriaceae bacterium]
MTESFLHYIWQFQYFEKADLATSAGERLTVFQPGFRNAHAGPDFSEAKIKIDNLEWRGSVEIHINASGWNDHRHGDDQAYENVVLHVVWENDKPIKRTDGTVMPTLELKSRVNPDLWNHYKKLFTSVESIPCSNHWPKISALVKLSMLEKTVVQRLELKAQGVMDILVKNNNDWEETCYQLLFKNFGFKVNADPMVQLAHSLPFKVLMKHPAQLEALLFGQAGFLEKAKADEYVIELKREYDLLKKKYNLTSKMMNEAQWRFLRLRPGNFPTVRLAQLAALFAHRKNMFSEIIEADSYRRIVDLLDTDQSRYWQQHYRFGKQSKTKVPGIGKSSIDNIVINTVAPLLTAYGKIHDDVLFVERAVEWLQNIPAENNKITRAWAGIGHNVTSAFDSQGLIELYNTYCLKRKCLECAVGSAIIQS